MATLIVIYPIPHSSVRKDSQISFCKDYVNIKTLTFLDQNMQERSNPMAEK
jgi:hypothetical protein